MTSISTEKHRILHDLAGYSVCLSRFGLFGLDGDGRGIGVNAAAVVGVTAVDLPAVQRSRDLRQMHGAAIPVLNDERGKLLCRGIVGQVGLTVREGAVTVIAI